MDPPGARFPVLGSVAPGKALTEVAILTAQYSGSVAKNQQGLDGTLEKAKEAVAEARGTLAPYETEHAKRHPT